MEGTPPHPALLFGTKSDMGARSGTCLSNGGGRRCVPRKRAWQFLALWSYAGRNVV